MEEELDVVSLSVEEDDEEVVSLSVDEDEEVVSLSVEDDEEDDSEGDTTIGGFSSSEGSSGLGLTVSLHVVELSVSLHVWRISSNVEFTGGAKSTLGSSSIFSEVKLLTGRIFSSNNGSYGIL